MTKLRNERRKKEPCDATAEPESSSQKGPRSRRRGRGTEVCLGQATEELDVWPQSVSPGLLAGSRAERFPSTDFASLAGDPRLQPPQPSLPPLARRGEKRGGGGAREDGFGMVSGGGLAGGREGRRVETPRGYRCPQDGACGEPPPLPTRGHSRRARTPSQGHPICWRLDLALPAPRAVRSSCVLFTSPRVLTVLLWQPEQTKTNQNYDPLPSRNRCSCEGRRSCGDPVGNLFVSVLIHKWKCPVGLLGRPSCP